MCIDNTAVIILSAYSNTVWEIHQSKGNYVDVQANNWSY